MIGLHINVVTDAIRKLKEAPILDLDRESSRTAFQDALGSRFLVSVVDYFVNLGVDFMLWEHYFQQKGVDVGYLEADFGPLGIKLWLWKSILGIWDLISGL